MDAKQASPSRARDAASGRASAGSSVSSASRQSSNSPSRSVKDKKTSQKDGAKAQSNPNNGRELKFNLTDPADILAKLENADLTEEETEELLQQAYELNRKLKQHMQAQEMSKHSSPLAKGNLSLGSRSRTMYPTLPPISSHGKRSSPEGSKPKVNPVVSKSTPEFTRQHTQSKMKSPEPKSSSGKRSASKPKPEWNDRFNYT